ncbi:MAG: hypothetical protein JO079_05515 [Frankiaceae bacterium]|nr:hypothetical protein [Frankiaceae bacterium]
MTTEEQALRSALTDAVVGQPGAPHDRVDAVRRLHTRRRQRQSVALGTAAVVAVAAAALGVVSARTGGTRPDAPANRHLPAWALAWPDARDPSIPQRVLDGAVEAWSHMASLETGTTPLALQTIWYRAAKVANGSEIVVVFEVASPEYGNQLVVGSADASQVMDGQPAYKDGETPWILSLVNAPRPGSHVLFGLNVHDSNSQSTSSFPDNVSVVMADPRARSVEWHVTGADRLVHRVVSPMDRGFAAIDVGQIRSRVHVDDVRDRHGKVLAGGVDVGVPGAPDSFDAQLTEVPAFTDVPNTPNSLGDAAGQGGTQNESEGIAYPLHGTTIYARCYGGPRIVIGIDSDAPGHRVVIPCDDREHVVNGPPLLAHSKLASEGVVDANGNFVPNPKGAPSHAYNVSASKDTAWRVEVVAR